ncbi:MAG: DinB family protein [Acidobacteria bacterium]|nr:DinB family protein [Acidobacteriota bacterium]
MSAPAPAQLRAVAQFLQVFESEHKTTMNVLRAIPEGRNAYRPHEKSMTLGELAFHVAYSPLGIAKAMKAQSFAEYKPPEAPADNAALLAGAEVWQKEACELLSTFTEEDMAGAVPLPNGSAFPNAMFFWMNLYHMVHHRGQLSVYLRLVGGKVPSIYGPSADDNPFAAA